MELAQYEQRSIVPLMNSRLVCIGGEYATKVVDAADDLRPLTHQCSRSRGITWNQARLASKIH